MKGSAEYIRNYYKVPAKRFGRITFQGKPGIITGFRDAYLLVRLDGATKALPCHPTWEIEYLTKEDPMQDLKKRLGNEAALVAAYAEGKEIVVKIEHAYRDEPGPKQGRWPLLFMPEQPGDETPWYSSELERTYSYAEVEVLSD